MKSYTLWNRPAESNEERAATLKRNGFAEEILDRIKSKTVAVEAPDISDRLKPFDTKVDWERIHRDHHDMIRY